MMKCGNKDCLRPAVATVRMGDGSPILMCHSCGLRATSVALNVGIVLAVEAIEAKRARAPRLTHDELFGG